jgi:ribonuclease VapC
VIVLDASALLALLGDEPGADRVDAALAGGGVIGAVNFAEVVAKLSGSGMPDGEVREILDGLGLDVVAFDADLAYRTGSLRPATRTRGLSIGDRACLALGQRESLPVLTADRRWDGAVAGVELRWVR